MTEYLIALGSNLPTDKYDLTSILSAALDQLHQRQGVSVDRISPWYRTPAWPEGSGPDFVNGAALLRSSYSPIAILPYLHEVEKALGRERRERWGARTYDLDLIGAGALIVPDVGTVTDWIESGPDAARIPDELLLPHPRLHERAFVLVPLCDIAPDWVHPVLNRSATQLLDSLPQAEVEAVSRIETG